MTVCGLRFRPYRESAVGIVCQQRRSVYERPSPEYGPHAIDPFKIVMVWHGTGTRDLRQAKLRRSSKDSSLGRANACQAGHPVEICGVAANCQGLLRKIADGFVTVVPAGPYALAYWQTKGYTLHAVGATMPTLPISELNKADINKESD